jgi:hypothetical protein
MIFIHNLSLILSLQIDNNIIAAVGASSSHSPYKV